MHPIRSTSVVPGLSISAGGPTFSVSSLCEATARAGVDTSIVTVAAPPGGTQHLPDRDLIRLTQVRGFHSRRFRILYAPGFTERLLTECQRTSAQIIHNHGLWTQPNHAASQVAKKLKLPMIVSTHGMLADWAWRHHAWKKRPIWWLWQGQALKSAAVLRATSKQEAADLRARGLRNPIALVPNGVDLPAWKGVPVQRNGTRVALFLSRIHPVKGLMNLVKAWARVRPPGWRMVICGPDENGHAREVRAKAELAGISGSFEFRPQVYGENKNALFAEADLFVLPSFTENFGVAIAEAMAAGLPVITTKAAPWPWLPKHDCGWWIDIGVEPLETALRQAFALSDAQRREMGLRGRAVVAERFSWDQIGKAMKAVYSWLLGAGEKPDCIQD